MPGFPLAALGAGLGQWAKYAQDQQAQRERQQMLMLQLQRYQQEQQDRQRDRATQAALFQVEAGGGGGIGPVNPTPGLSGGPVGVPMSQAAPAALAADNTFNTPPSPRPSSPGGAGGAVRSAGDAWLQQNAPVPTQGRAGPQPGTGNLPWRMEPAGPDAYASVSGPGAQSVAPSTFDPNAAPRTNAAGQNIGSGPMPPPRGGPGGVQMADASGAAPPSAPRTPQQVAQMMAPDAHAQAAKDALVAKIRQIPGLDDGQRGELFVKQWSLIRPEEAEYARRYIEDQRETHRDVRDDVRAERTDARIDYRDQLKRADEDRRAKLKFGPVQEITDSSGKKTYVQYNEVGDMRPVKVPEGSTLSKVGSRGANTAPLDEARAKFWAEVLAKGGTLPAGLRRSGVVEQVMRAMPGESEGVTPGDFISRHSEVQANTGSLRNMTRMADSAISFEKLAEKNFDVALKLAPDAVPTDLGPFFNQWIEKGETMLGDPNVPPYVAAMLTGANEYAKVMSGSTGTAASTNDSRRQAAEMFSPYFSLPQISQVIAVAKADMKNRENTLTEQVSQIKQRLGSSAPVTIAPAATPRATGQESQSAPPSGGVIKLDADGNVIQQ